MKCPFCNKRDRVDIKHFDSPSEHLVIVIKNNHTHVHGPFQNEKVIREMAKSLISEMEKNGIKYLPATEDRIEV